MAEESDVDLEHRDKVKKLKLKRSLLGRFGSYREVSATDLCSELAKSGFFPSSKDADISLARLREDRDKCYSFDYSDTKSLKIKFSHTFSSPEYFLLNETVHYFRVEVVNDGSR